MDKADIRRVPPLASRCGAAGAGGPASTSSTSMPATTFAADAVPVAPRTTSARDEYGGSLENRVRLLRELIEDTQGGGRRAAAPWRCRFAGRRADRASDGITSEGEARDVVGDARPSCPTCGTSMSAPGRTTAQTSRFAREGYAGALRRVRQAADHASRWSASAASPRPTPWSRQIRARRPRPDRRGAARRSPIRSCRSKIEEGRIEDIRECIGCNICVAGDMTVHADPLHAEPDHGRGMARAAGIPRRIAAEGIGDDAVLVVGAGPAGLEAARALGQRGYEVHARRGRRTSWAAASRAKPACPGLAAWARVRDYRVGQLAALAECRDLSRQRIDRRRRRSSSARRTSSLATGSRWRRDGVGRCHAVAVPGFDALPRLTPDDLMAGDPAGRPGAAVRRRPLLSRRRAGRAAARATGCAVTLVTPAPLVSAWTVNTLEQVPIQKRLLGLGVTILANQSVIRFDGAVARLACVFTGRESEQPGAALVTVTARLPEDGLARDLAAAADRVAAAGIRSIASIGDGLAPGTIAAAVYAGHRYARELDEPPAAAVPFAVPSMLLRSKFRLEMASDALPRSEDLILSHSPKLCCAARRLSSPFGPPRILSASCSSWPSSSHQQTGRISKPPRPWRVSVPTAGAPIRRHCFESARRHF